MIDAQNTAPHISVLLDDVLRVLPDHQGAVVVDGTFGAGGYTKGLLADSPRQVIAIDRDPNVAEFVTPLQSAYQDRFQFVQGTFGDMVALLDQIDVTAVDGIVLDLGVSSMQLDQPMRGFSFRYDGPLDMRMGNTGPTAAEAVNSLEENELADILYQLGEERRSRQVAAAIVRARAEKAIETTQELADIVRPVVRKGANRKAAEKIDPATRTFMALRLYVNDELGEVQRALHAAETLLKPGGVLAVVSFHSLEDRLVKLFLRDRATPPSAASRHLPAPPPNSPKSGRGDAVFQPTFRFDKALGGSKGIVPSDAAQEANPRARSSRLRAAIRTSAPAWDAAVDTGVALPDFDYAEASA